MKCNEAKHSDDYKNQETSTDLTAENSIIWARDEAINECQLCNSQFSFINRRHHCRMCGKIFCGKCCSIKKTVSGYDEPQRVCNECNKDVNE